MLTLTQGCSSPGFPHSHHHLFQGTPFPGHPPPGAGAPEPITSCLPGGDVVPVLPGELKPALSTCLGASESKTQTTKPELS